MTSERLVRAGAYAVLVMLTFWVVITGIFLIPAGPVVFGVETSYSWPYVIVTNLGLLWLARRIDQWDAAFVVPPVAWFAFFLLLGQGGPTHHVLEPGTTAGNVFFFIGLLTFSAGIVATTVPRGTRKRGASRTPTTRTGQ